MKLKSILIVLAVIVVLLAILFVLPRPQTAAISNFEECAAAGYPIMESYPRQCRANEQTFVEDISEPAAETAQFNTPVTLELMERAVFTDGFEVRLFRIEDSRCKPDVQCIWAGELKATVHLTIDGHSLSRDFYLATQTQKSFSAGAYTLTLQDATETSITFTVVKSFDTQ